MKFHDLLIPEQGPSRPGSAVEIFFRGLEAFGDGSVRKIIFRRGLELNISEGSILDLIKTEQHYTEPMLTFYFQLEGDVKTDIFNKQKVISNKNTSHISFINERIGITMPPGIPMGAISVFINQELLESYIYPNAETLPHSLVDILQHDFVDNRNFYNNVYSTSIKQTGLNLFKLKRGFKSLFGKTVFAFIRQERMKIAKQLLDDKKITVLEAAIKVGYSNPSHFASAFRKEYGINPGKYQYLK